MAETLADFLLARIAEDEAAAHAATPSPWVADEGYVMTPEQPQLNHYGGLWDCEGASSLCMEPPDAVHIARHDPARVLAECEAKRKIMELHPPHGTNQPIYCETCGDPEFWDQTPPVEWPRPTLRALALPYADHPEFREEWR